MRVTDLMLEGHIVFYLLLDNSSEIQSFVFVTSEIP